MASVYKRGKTYTASISIKDGGKFKKKSKGGFKGKTEAKVWAREQEELASKGYSVTIKEKLLSDFFHDWHELYKQDVSHSTRVWYNRVEVYIKELLPNITVQDFSRELAQMFFNNLGKNYSTETVQKVKNQLHQAMKSALYEGIILRDPITDISVSGRDGKHRDLKFLEEAQIKALASYIQEIQPSERSYSDMMIYLGLFTGARYEELAALTWNDFTNGYIDINKSWNQITKVIQETKTPSSIRKISVPKNIIDDFSIWNPAHERSQFIFGSKRPITGASVNKRLKAQLEAIKSPKIITFHGLRHTHASWLISQGVDIQYVSERLGHTNVAMTLRVYTHMLDKTRHSEDDKSLKLLQNL
ncbi:phage integrase [Weissella oryzae SG25]|uniref:Phage integrase n=1 Tax=Weissella oryzae (strain DSM 25784 / JCM 18191 / LMG 30913 / SG25) TaxID=1329250 RepID=A0A069CWN5_WEIOS|nr:site-specific integrase [Weissella oryzae]GAK31864.1 phage integrase [Weissella oryzae SG25]